MKPGRDWREGQILMLRPDGIARMGFLSILSGWNSDLGSTVVIVPQICLPAMRQISPLLIETQWKRVGGKMGVKEGNPKACTIEHALQTHT